MHGIHWKEAGKHYLPINRNGTIHDLWSAAKDTDFYNIRTQAQNIATDYNYHSSI